MAKSQLLDRLALFTMAAVLCSAIVVLVHEFWNVSARDVVVSIAALPRQAILAAVALTAMSYLLLTGYNFFWRYAMCGAACAFATCYLRRLLPSP